MGDLTLSKGSFLTPQNFEEAIRMSEFMSKSSMIPSSYHGKPSDILIAMQMGIEIGLQPIQSLQNIAVINGRPSIWGDGMRALIMSAPDLADIKESFDDGTLTATCSIFRKIGNKIVEFTQSFSRQDAEGAGLWGRNTWKSYPKRMLQWRAFGFAARDAYADRLRGIQMVEESSDIAEKEKYMGQAEIESDDNNLESKLPLYGDDEFENNFDKWRRLIESGRTSPETIIGMISSKFQLTENQMNRIQGLAQ